MPLNLAVIGIDYIVQKTCGNEAERHHLESLGFVEGHLSASCPHFSAITLFASKTARSESEKILPR